MMLAERPMYCTKPVNRRLGRVAALVRIGTSRIGWRFSAAAKIVSSVYENGLVRYTRIANSRDIARKPLGASCTLTPVAVRTTKLPRL